MHVDFLIIGGGPAGCACGTVLGQAGARVAIVERTSFHAFRIGETLHPRIKPLLTRLGIPSERVVGSVPDYGLTSIWGDSQPRRGLPSLFNAYGPALRVDRVAFDRQLFENAGRNGVRLIAPAIVESATNQESRWRASVSHYGRRFTIYAPFVIDATGRSRASLCAPSRSRIRADKLVALAFLPNLAEPRQHLNRLPITLVESVPSGWWYSTVLPSGRLLVVLFTDFDLIRPAIQRRSGFITAMLESARRTRRRLLLAGATLIHARQWVFDARTSIRRMPVGNRWMAIGDSLMSVDPLSGIGVLEAMQSGIAAGEVLLKQDIHEPGSFRSFLLQSLNRYNSQLQIRAEVYGLEKRWSLFPFWARRLPSSGESPDAKVRLAANPLYNDYASLTS